MSLCGEIALDRSYEFQGETVDEALYEQLILDEGGRILFLVMDGLGGFRTADRGSELAEADCPNLDALASEGITGMLDPVAPGITPGSGPGHLGLFGYNPFAYEIGRGALSAAGLGYDLEPGDVAARVNLCTLAADGTISDRRAGRLPTEEAAAVCEAILEGLDIEGVEVVLAPEREHRALLILRGDGLDSRVGDTDPQAEGVEPRAPQALAQAAERTAGAVAHLLDHARTQLAGRDKANFLLLRGFDSQTDLPSFQERYRLRAQVLAQYPMYFGIARLLGMDARSMCGSLGEQVDELRDSFARFDFTFFHLKATDSAGEDADFERKCAAIEEADRSVVPVVRSLEPDVVVVTGDHATPSQYGSHSWHPVPVLLWSKRAGRDLVTEFNEDVCAGGAIGRRRSCEFFPLVLASAGRLTKYGA